jgi:hypothetical protein
MTNIRTAVTVCATLALIGCCAYVANTRPAPELVQLSADAVVAEDGNGAAAGLTDEEKAEVLKEGDKAKAPCQSDDEEGCSDKVVNPNIGMGDDASPGDKPEFPQPEGTLQKNCMQAKVYAYGVADSLDDIENGGAGPVKEFLQCMAPMPMTAKNVVPEACAEQIHKCTENMDGDLPTKINTALQDSMNNGKGILKKVIDTRHGHGHMVELDWEALGLDEGANTAMEDGAMHSLAVKKLDYQDTEGDLVKAFGASSGPITHVPGSDSGLSAKDVHEL